MEEEIDLRPYVEAIIRHWYWIVGAGILAAVLAFLLFSFRAPIYEATALVAVISPREVVQFDDRIRETTTTQPLRAFPQLALSDQVLRSLLDQNLIEGITSVKGLRQHLQAEVGEDISIMRFSATSPDPREATELVNAWASLFVTWANEIYGNQSDEQVEFFENQLAEAELELADRENDLISFQAINRTEIISNTLVTYVDTQADYLETQRQLILLTQNVQRLQSQLATQPDDQSATFAEQLTVLALQLQAYDANTALPLQLQLSDDISLTGTTQAEQISLLNDLLVALSRQAEQTETELAILEPRILEVQADLQESQTEYVRLVRNQVIAQETYMSLARKVDEERITSQDTRSGVRLASAAAIPSAPAGVSPILAAFVCGILGGFIAVCVVFFKEWRTRGHLTAK